MARKSHRFRAGTALVIGLSLVAAPASAGGHWRGSRHHHRHGHDNTGDVIAGILVLGAIAAIASEASRNDGGEYPDRSDDLPPEGAYRAGGMDRAVDMCVAEVERRNGRVGEVDGANRNADGWFVSGSTPAGSPWTCRIGADGRAATVEIGDSYRAGQAGSGAASGNYPAGYDDTYYETARARLGTVAYTQPPVTEERLAAVTN